MNELKIKITEFAESLTKLRNAEPVTQFYCGPVLFEDGAAAAILQKSIDPKRTFCLPETGRPVHSGPEQGKTHQFPDQYENYRQQNYGKEL